MPDNIHLSIEIKPDLEKLRAYTQASLALADQLRIMREALKTLGRESGERETGQHLLNLLQDNLNQANKKIRHGEY
jgi:hypothetical protein